MSQYSEIDIKVLDELLSIFADMAKLSRNEFDDPNLYEDVCNYKNWKKSILNDFEIVKKKK